MIDLPVLEQKARSPAAGASCAGLEKRVKRVLESTGMRTIKALLDPIGLTVEPTLILHKQLSPRHLRLMFPVIGGTVRLGMVVSIVCLYDCVTEETLYAHPMHAGPTVNPLLKHSDGPMASPKAQPGNDGRRAAVRMIAHKAALWQRFLLDCEVAGPSEASARWRRSYYWALKRLYFCMRCTHCRWGTPFFEGPDPTAPPKRSTQALPHCSRPLRREQADVVASVLSSDAWAIECSYVQRGGFDVSDSPRLIRHLDQGRVQLIFPTNAALIEGGTLVGLSVVHSTRPHGTVFAYTLAAGSEPEIQFLLGDEALGLPSPCSHASDARARYIAWRERAWSQFWLDELDQGIAVASARWLRNFWIALEDLFAGNDLATIGETQVLDSEMKYSQPAITVVDRTGRSPLASRNGHTRQRLAIEVEAGTRPLVPFETLENTGTTCFAGHAAHFGHPELQAIEISTLMVNLGKRCNQTCGHCHVDAGPHRVEEMSRTTMELVLGVLRRHEIETLDITGGAPEMNPHFRHLASTASGLCRRVVDRCNLTILLEPGYEDLPSFLAQHGVEIIASLPSYEAEDVDRQRGRTVFQKSIDAMKTLNALGYGRVGTGLVLNLVYNPVGVGLAPSQPELEQRFRRELGNRFGIRFNHLFAMNNMPVRRFREQLVRQGRLSTYMENLVGFFNPATVNGLMCRHSLSIGWDGRLYDCDFNHAAGIPLCDGLPGHIRDFDAIALRTRPIRTAAHCFGCSAGNGSSCNGALANSVRHNSSLPDGQCAEGMTLSAAPDVQRNR